MFGNIKKILEGIIDDSWAKSPEFDEWWAKRQKEFAIEYEKSYRKWLKTQPKEYREKCERQEMKE